MLRELLTPDDHQWEGAPKNPVNSSSLIGSTGRGIWDSILFLAWLLLHTFGKLFSFQSLSFSNENYK